MDRVVFSHKSDLWSTPQDLFDKLNKEFHFDLDPCATDFNHKCDRYFTEKDNGLLQKWNCECAFVNPPYSCIKEWVKKCFYNQENLICRSVMLLPARTDTRWFHDYIYNNKCCDIRFIKGRLKFGDSKNSAPFPSMIVIFDIPF